jgi:hypothetical protein
MPACLLLKRTRNNSNDQNTEKTAGLWNINIEKRSGNRMYDESILRVLRAVDPLSPYQHH